MVLVAFRMDAFFRAKTISIDAEKEKEAMVLDAGEELRFEIMTEEEFKEWESSQPKQLQPPTIEERLLATEQALLDLIEVLS